MTSEQRLTDLETTVKRLQDRLNHLSPQTPVGASQADYEEFFGPSNPLDRLEKRLEALIEFLSVLHPDLRQTLDTSNKDPKNGVSPGEQEEIEQALDAYPGR